MLYVSVMSKAFAALCVLRWHVKTVISNPILIVHQNSGEGGGDSYQGEGRGRGQGLSGKGDLISDILTLPRYPHSIKGPDGPAISEII